MATFSRRGLLKALGGTAAASVAVLRGGAAEASTKKKPKPPTSIGVLSIPKIGVSKKIYSGTKPAILNRGGFCLWLGTAPPGSFGHSAYFAHRTSHGGPMRKAHLLVPGDTILVNDVTYTVTSTEIVPRTMWVKGLSYGSAVPRSLTIVACSKANGLPTSLKYRIIVRAIG